MADSLPSRNLRCRPSVLQWNALSLRVRKTDLSQHLQQHDYDVLALQEVRGTAFDLRLPGYVGYNGATSCTVDSCGATPCLDSNHPQDTPRVAVYVRRELPHVVVDVASATGGPLECCAVTVRLRGVDTTVASIYIRPRRPWDASMLTRLTPLLGRHYLLCGDMNAHHSAWGSRRNCCRGKDLMEVVHRLGLQVLNTGSFTHIQRLARTSLTAIDVTLATPGVCYGWATASDSWGSDHLPILVTPAGGKVPRSRRYKVVDWRIYRQHLDDPSGLRDFFGAMTRAAEAATIVTTVPVNQPVPDIHHLNLRAARRRAERTYLRGGSRTAFNRLNAACRRHANQRWRQGWQGICNTVGKSKGGAKAWRLLGSLISGPSLRQPVLTAAIAMNLREDALAEQLADQFSVVAVAPPAAVPDRGAPGLPQGHHPAWAASQIEALCRESITAHELNAALARTKRRSAPGADGITYQMLRNLDDAGRRRLLGAMNEVWWTGVLPETWQTAVVVPVRKPGRPASSITSYRPVSLTSSSCKLMEAVVLPRLRWIAGAMNFMPEQQTGFRRYRCTADSIADVVSTLEDARNRGDVALLVLLDVQSAFDGLPHVVIESALDALGVGGCLRRFITQFLTGRTLRVRVGRTTSSPRAVTSGVPQGSILSPFLFNLVLAALPAAIPEDERYPTQCSIYADDVALWVHGPRRHLPAVRRSLQRTLDAVASFFRGIGLQVSPAKTVALIVHPNAAARVYSQKLTLGGTLIPWSRTVTYLGLQIDHRLTWIPAVKAVTTRAARVQTMVGRILLRGRGCPLRVALRLYHGAATAAMLYALPLVQLSLRRKDQLEKPHRLAIRTFLGLPRSSPVAATLAEAQASPVSLLMLRQALLHVDRMHRAPEGAALLQRLEGRPSSRMGGICALYKELVRQPPTPVVPPPPTQRPPDIHLHLEGLTKRHSPACELQQAAAAKIHQQLRGHLLMFTDGSVYRNPPSAAAACRIPELGTTLQCRLPFPASSTAAELAGLHLAVDHLAANLPTQPVAILTDSRPALQALQHPEQAGVTVSLLLEKLLAVMACGVTLSLHWLPSHVGIAGNEEADAAAKEAHRPAVPVSRAVAAGDFSRERLLHLLKAAHPDQRVANGKPPRPLREASLERRELRLLLRLRTGSAWPAARKFCKGRCTSPDCSRCGSPETLEHILCFCPALDGPRDTMRRRYRHLGLPATTVEDLIFPPRSEALALRAFLEFAEAAGLESL